MLRPATAADLAAVVSLAYDEEASWFGEPESSREEIAEYVDFHGGVAAGEVVDDGGRVRGFLLVPADGEAVLFADPADPAPPYALLVGRALERGASRTEVSTRDARRIAWLEAAGWTHTRSSFDLARDGVEPVEPPAWPEGVELAAYRPGADDEELHRFVYVDAAFGAVPGHVDRPIEAWRQLFGTRAQGWVARRDGVPVGWVVGRVADDGRGWIPQLAVAVGERRAGLGRALLLHSCADLLGRGATGLGLAVQAANDRAIGLYRSVGFEVTNEWRVYEPPAG